MMIKPTVGRVVWFTPAQGDLYLADYAVPFAAIVTYVWGDRCVNLTVCNPDGSTRGETSVTLLQDDDQPSTYGRHAEWMPYQVGQAKKHDTTANANAPQSQS